VVSSTASMHKSPQVSCSEATVMRTSAMCNLACCTRVIMSAGMCPEAKLWSFLPALVYCSGVHRMMTGDDVGALAGRTISSTAAVGRAVPLAPQIRGPNTASRCAPAWTCCLFSKIWTQVVTACCQQSS
jgi:hypothetical protein